MDTIVSLNERAGIEVALSPESLALTFGEGVVAPTAECRFASELSSVLRDKSAARPEDCLYSVYRGVAPREAADVIAAHGLVYVALVLRAGSVGPEFPRTRGHVNNAAQRTAVAYPEVHEIWNGNALLYLQKAAATNPGDVCAMPLAPGDTAVVAPGWASLLVNTGTDPLVVGTWRTTDCHPRHDELEALGGMAHFVVADTKTAEGYAFEPNRRYDATVTPTTPRRLTTHDLADFGLRRGQPMLTAFRRNPDFLRFLVRPQDYSHVWKKLYRGAEAS